MAKLRHAWVSGLNPHYTLNLSEEAMDTDLAPLNGTYFDRYRAAQDIANATHDLVTKRLKAGEGSR